MIRGLRSLLPEGIKRGIKSLLGMPQRRLHGDWRMLEFLGPVLEPHVILDVGANRGQFFRRWQAWSPAAQVHAFEPIAEECERLRRACGADSSVTVNNVAVGSVPGELAFRVWDGATECSSLLEHDPKAWERIYTHRGGVSERRVPVTTVDAYCRERLIDDVFLAKIDVQGYELEVLKGAEAMLPRIRHLFLETGIRPLYRGAPGFGVVCDHLLTRRFHLAAMRSWHAGDHVLVEADLLFRRDDLAPQLDKSGCRVYEGSG